MKQINARLARGWVHLSPRFLPFADAATAELPIGRLLRLSLFQVSVGMALVLLNGTLNRVMIVEMGVSSALVALMVSLPLLFAPLRPLIGFKSDTHRSVLGWKRVPYIWFGTMLQFGGLAIMPFALIIMSGDTHGPAWIGHAASALAFLLVGAGLHTTQTAGLALATDLAPPQARPRVVAFLYVMLLVGIVASALVFGAVLQAFSQVKLIQLIQGAAVATFFFNVIALWKQETRDPSKTAADLPRPDYWEQWAAFKHGGRVSRVLLAVGLGTAGFSMQDILLEPYGGEVLHLGVAATTVLTALLAAGTLCAFAIAARSLEKGTDPYRLAGYGALLGVVAFSLVIFAAPLGSPMLFRVGVVLIGFGGGLFGVGMLTGAMSLAENGFSGMALGAWGAVQACAMGGAIALGGAIRDVAAHVSDAGYLGPALVGPAVGYGVVYYLEILLLLITMAVVGPLVRAARAERSQSRAKFGLAEFPG